jgi:hypothetical protein
VVPSFATEIDAAGVRAALPMQGKAMHAWLMGAIGWIL